MCAHDLEGIVAKRLADRYDPQVQWLKIKNPDYSQKAGRGDLFNGMRRRPWQRDDREPVPERDYGCGR
jgi:hypothetical protein